MSKRFRVVMLLTLVLAILGGLPALAQAGAAYTASKPKLSAAPVVNVPFTVSGVVKPKATVESRTVVKIRLYKLSAGRWGLTGTYRARLGASASGTAYSRRLAVSSEGKYAVRALHYRAGRLVKSSLRTSFAVARRITIDSMVNGWMAPSLADTMAPADTPLDVVFTTPADWASDDPAKHYGAAHFIWGDFEKVDADGLIWHTDGLQPGRYDWMRDCDAQVGHGLAGRHAADRRRQDLTRRHARAALPAGGHLVRRRQLRGHGLRPQHRVPHVASSRRRAPTRSSGTPTAWSPAATTGSAGWTSATTGRWWPTAPAQRWPSTPTPTRLRDGGAGRHAAGHRLHRRRYRMMCWRTIYFTTAGDFTKTRATRDPLTWYTGGLAPGNYEWECWMGPQCHHGTIVVQ